MYVCKKRTACVYARNVAKRICKRVILQGTELMSLSAAVSHFLNCLLSSAQIIHPQQNLEEVTY